MFLGTILIHSETTNMETLFHDKYETYNDIGNAYDRRAVAALLPIVDDAVKQGVKLRDLHYVFSGAIAEVLLSALMNRNQKIYTEKL